MERRKQNYSMIAATKKKMNSFPLAPFLFTTFFFLESSVYTFVRLDAYLHLRVCIKYAGRRPTSLEKPLSSLVRMREGKKRRSPLTEREM